jgi:hypothetical protein
LWKLLLRLSASPSADYSLLNCWHWPYYLLIVFSNVSDAAWGSDYFPIRHGHDTGSEVVDFYKVGGLPVSGHGGSENSPSLKQHQKHLKIRSTNNRANVNNSTTSSRPTVMPTVATAVSTSQPQSTWIWWINYIFFSWNQFIFHENFFCGWWYDQNNVSLKF